MDSDPDTVRFPREAVEDIQLPPPAEASGRTFIGPAPAPRPGRRKAAGTTTPLPQAVVVQTDPFAPVSTEVIAPELVAAAVAAVQRPIESPDEVGLPAEAFDLDPIALDPGTVALAATEPFMPEPAPEPFVPEPAPQAFMPEPAPQPFVPEPAPEPIPEEPRVVFHPERLQATDIDLPQPVAMTPELAAAAIEPAPLPPPPSEILQPGTLVDDYEVISWVSGDALGGLYAAHDGVAQSVSIKVIARGVCRDEPSHGRLVASAEAARHIDSLHMVEIQAAGRLVDGRVYLVTEPLYGESLAARMARGRLPIDEAMEILSQVAAAVADAHKTDVVRCDLAPESVIVRQSEEGLHVKLLQAGVARLSRGSAPERTRGEPLGPPSDIHALGLLAQHMLVGTPVDQSLIVSEARPEVPAAVDQLVDSMLADDPRRRPSALEVHAAARKLAHALYRGSSAELPFKLQARLWLQKPSNRVLLGVQVCLLLAGLASFLFLRDSESSDASAAPKQEPATAPAKSEAPAPKSEPAAVPEKKKSEPAAAPEKKKSEPAAAPEKKKSEPVPAAPEKKKSEPAAHVHKSAPRPAAAPPKPATAPPKPAAEPPKPVAPPKPAAEPPKPATPPPAAGDRDAPIKDPFGNM